MSAANWGRAPSDAQAWAPDTAKFMAGWYRTDIMGRWYYSQSKGAGWWKIDPPSRCRQRQMELRP